MCRSEFQQQELESVTRGGLRAQDSRGTDGQRWLDVAVQFCSDGASWDWLECNGDAMRQPHYSKHQLEDGQDHES